MLVHYTEFDPSDRISALNLGAYSAIKGPSLWFQTTNSGDNKRAIIAYRDPENGDGYHWRCALISQSGAASSLGSVYLYNSDPQYGAVGEMLNAPYDVIADKLSDALGRTVAPMRWFDDDLGFAALGFIQCETVEGTWTNASRAKAFALAFNFLQGQGYPLPIPE